jgi:hypothetical protein
MKKTNLIYLVTAFAVLAGCAKKEVRIPDKGGDKPDTTKTTTPQLSPEGDVVGKVTVGYQGWFSAPGDGSVLNNWNHQNLEMWPDVREYEKTYQAVLQNQSAPALLGNGQPAKMFSSYDQSTVNLHFKWMQDYGIDCAALQRFTGELNDPPYKAQRDGMALKVKAAAEATGRKFYIMYDISGHKDMQSVLKSDWTNFIKGSLNLLASPAYAIQNGKPVVCIFGMGYLGAPVPGGGDAAACLDVINWFKNQGCYVIGSVPMDWRTPNNNMTRDNFAPVYNAFNMLAPWAVGALTGSTYQPWIKGDFEYLKARGIDYQPIAYPGTSFANSGGGKLNNIPRLHGDFMWTQAAVMRSVGVKSLYVAMFDELNEATSIFKVAENATQAPVGTSYVNLDQDGVAVTSDFYLRLTNDIGKMIKGLTPYQATHPTVHMTGSVGPIANGIYKIINKNSALALEVKDQLLINNSAIDQAAYTGDKNQLWELTSLGGDHYKIIGVQSGLSLEVAGQSPDPGAKVQLYDYKNIGGQQWIITPVTGGYFTVQNVQSGHVLEVPGQSKAVGTLIDQWSGDGGDNQQWMLGKP